MDLITFILTSLLIGFLLHFISDPIKKEIEKLKHRRKIAEVIDQLPGPKWYPIVGCAWLFLMAERKDFWKVLRKRCDMYKPLFRTWMGKYPIIHVMKAEHVEIVLNNSFEKSLLYRFFIPWAGTGLFLQPDISIWRSRRKILTPTFHFAILDDFQDIFNEKSQTLVKLLSEKSNGEYFEVTNLLARCSLDFICETAMGTKINALENDSEFLKAVFELPQLITYRTYTPLLHNDFIFKFTQLKKKQDKLLSIVHGFSRKVIREKREKLQNNNQLKKRTSEEEKIMGRKERKAFLDLLLEGNTMLSDEEIRQEVDTFVLAGHDTTAVAIGWTLFALANYPDIQAKVQAELDEIFQGKERPMTPEDIIRLKYLDRVIKEVLRLYVPAHIVGRKLDKEIVLDNLKIPHGVMVSVDLFQLHRDPEQWPDPERFDPDRFLPEIASQRHPYAYCPFSAGPRNCIGRKFAARITKTEVAWILRRFNIKSIETPQNVEVYSEVLMRPQNGLHIALQERQ
ncbi:unnamed protein product [Brassicogethes aeneus]|uniref:Cytochrome P450 n=1 Tax=Brassicogethes aeneus TaxID=1431903 RepID=A0A9P0FDT6_BRAAE|nr:unnamed protein product [Brassicogethes aeneus]